MGVDFYTCNNCEDTFPDCGHYVWCETCGTHWCSDECAEDEGFISEHCAKFEELYNRDMMEDYRLGNCDYEDCTDCPNYRADSCKYCRKEDYDNYTLLNKALELLKMSRNDLVKIINSEN